MHESGISLASLAWKADELRRDGQTVILIAVDGQEAGLIGIADSIKDSAAQAVRDLKHEGLRVMMLTGDNRATAEAVAKALGITEFEAEVLPDKKAEVVQRLQKEGRTVAMAGDGINDAPALAQADVGIAMGTGTDIAMESGGITLVKGDLAGILRARKLSQATMRNIRQNLFFAFLYNSLGVPIAAGVLYPFFGLLAEPDSGGGRDELEFSFGDYEFAALAEGEALEIDGWDLSSLRLQTFASFAKESLETEGSAGVSRIPGPAGHFCS